MANEHSKHPSATKRGPGRYHSDGATKASPIKSKGTPSGFVLHQASKEKKERRALVKAMGRRQAIRIVKFLRCADEVAAFV